jgi:hypothetical protein
MSSSVKWIDDSCEGAENHCILPIFWFVHGPSALALMMLCHYGCPRAYGVETPQRTRVPLDLGAVTSRSLEPPAQQSRSHAVALG